MESKNEMMSFEELTAVDMVAEGEVAELLGDIRSDLAVICKEFYLMEPEDCGPEKIQLIHQKVADLRKLLTRKD